MGATQMLCIMCRDCHNHTGRGWVSYWNQRTKPSIHVRSTGTLFNMTLKERFFSSKKGSNISILPKTHPQNAPIKSDFAASQPGFLFLYIFISLFSLSMLPSNNKPVWIAITLNRDDVTIHIPRRPDDQQFVCLLISLSRR